MQSQARSGAKCNPQPLKAENTLSPTQLATPPPGTPMGIASGNTNNNMLLPNSGDRYFTGTPRTAHRSNNNNNLGSSGGGNRGGSGHLTGAGNGGGEVGGNSPVYGNSNSRQTSGSAGGVGDGGDDTLPYSIIHSLTQTTAVHQAHREDGGRHLHSAHYYSRDGGGQLYSSSSGRMNLPSPKSGGPAFAVGVTPSPAETPTPTMDEFDRMLKRQEAVQPQGANTAAQQTSGREQAPSREANTTPGVVPVTRKVSTGGTTTPSERNNPSVLGADRATSSSQSMQQQQQQGQGQRPKVAERMVSKLLSDENKKRQLLLDISSVVASLAHGNTLNNTNSSGHPAAPPQPAAATPRVGSAQGSQHPTPRVGPMTPSNSANNASGSRISPLPSSQQAPPPSQASSPPAAGQQNTNNAPSAAVAGGTSSSSGAAVAAGGPTCEQPPVPPSNNLGNRQKSSIGFSSPPPQTESDSLIRIVQAAVKSNTSSVTVPAAFDHQSTNGGEGGYPVKDIHRIGTVPASSSPHGQWPTSGTNGERSGTIENEVLSSAKRIHFDPSQQAPVRFGNNKADIVQQGNNNFHHQQVQGGNNTSSSPFGATRTSAGGGAYNNSGRHSGGATTTQIPSRSGAGSSKRGSKTGGDYLDDSSSGSVVMRPQRSSKIPQLVEKDLAMLPNKSTSRRCIKSESSAFSERTDGTFKSTSTIRMRKIVKTSTAQD